MLAYYVRTRSSHNRAATQLSVRPVTHPPFLATSVVFRIKSRKTLLKELQQKHVVRPDFSDDDSMAEQQKIQEMTDELTSMFAHCKRLVRSADATDSSMIREVSDSSKRHHPTLVRTYVSVRMRLLHSSSF